MRHTRRNGETFSELYRRTHVDLLAFLLRRCASPEDAADCLAETYLVAWEKRDRMPPGAETRPWLFGVARNVMRRGSERHGRTASAASALAAELRISGAVCPAPAVPEPDPVIAAVGELPELEREILTMLIWDELAPREVAAILGLSANVVRVRAHRARTKLKASLSARDGPDDPDPALTLRHRGHAGADRARGAGRREVGTWTEPVADRPPRPTARSRETDSRASNDRGPGGRQLRRSSRPPESV